MNRYSLVSLLLIIVSCSDSGNDEETNWTEECRPKRNEMLNAQTNYTNTVNDIFNTSQQACKLALETYLENLEAYASCLYQSDESELKDAADNFRQTANEVNFTGKELCQTAPFDSTWTGKIYQDYFEIKQ
tara:strand:+ start:251 stop:643 length:393 start_codon:yes stop_codon:yes gene_type:complete